jgi:CheY-like chemotaxis protein
MNSVMSDGLDDPNRILVVEDSADLRELLTIQLTFGGYEVFCANNGLEALDAVVHIDPHLVLADVRMPVLSGTDMTRRLRATPRFATLPVVLYTGINAENNADIQDALILPLVRCVQKGALMTVVLAALAELSTAARCAIPT